MTLPSARPVRRALLGIALAVVAAGAVWLAAPGEWRSATRPAVPVVAAENADGLTRLAQRIRRGPQEETPEPAPPPAAEPTTPREPEFRQTQEEADRKSVGCMTCHSPVDSQSMHEATTVKLGCTDCHGGNAEARAPAGAVAGTPDYERVKTTAHVQPRLPQLWKSAANPQRSFALLNQESDEFVRFVNPGDLRAAQKSCGQSGCHTAEVAQVPKSMMTTGPMLWSAAYYNNGTVPFKTPRFGESYGPGGTPQRVLTTPPPTLDEMARKGVLRFLEPLPRFEIIQPGNVLRVFERGQERPLEIGVPDREELPGRPANRLSARGYGTLNRTDPVGVSLQRTRLLDPMLSFLGTNDNPGDYRSSGCTACHVVYANDRSPVHSGPYASFGHRGRTQTVDPTIRKDESGHPIKHLLTRSIPSSQCVVCHHHPGTTVTNSYYGYTWWDNETDGALMYPETERKLSAREVDAIQRRNPEGAALRGKWSDPEFLANITDLNPKLTRTQFADFHGHGWVFRAVYKQNRKGELLDGAGAVVPHDDPQRFTKAVHLKDIHLEKGMHCVDCHFKQDSHGNGKLYGETRAAVEIGCVDCHGTIQARAALKTTGPAAPPGGTDLSVLTTPFGQRRFQWRGDILTQRSMVTKDLAWEVVQVLDSIDPVSGWALANPERAAKSRLAKTVRRDGTTWGLAPAGDEMKQLAHADSRMTCQSCHTSWVTSCFGCHLPMKANERKPMLHNEGDIQRNWTAYNFQTLRDDVFMLAIDGSAVGNRISPARSSCAVLVGSQNGNREWVYSQQQTVSAEGLAGHAFSTFVPHTVRATETKQCTDCHPSTRGDNNAWMAQLLMQGTNFYNFIGRYAYVAEGRSGLEAVVVTETEEPQAVIGSSLHRLAYPSRHATHVKAGGALAESHHHRGRDVLDVLGRDEVLGIQLRGEYLYTANGRGGFRAFDVAQIDQKGFSERVVTAPVSPLGQRLYVKTRYATAVASPTTLAVDPTRTQRPENQEQKIHPLYAYLYVTDREEGLVVIGNRADSPNRAGVATLLDGDPANNFLERAATFNPGGVLDGAVNLTVAGRYAYVLATRGLVIVDLDNPVQPRVVAELGAPDVVDPRAVAVQFRYAFVTDREGLKVIDVTDPARPRAVREATVRLADARGLTVSRTYAYVAAGGQGLAIVDVERPEQPRLDQTFDAGGAMNDARDVKIAMTNASLFAYVADGRNGLRVLQLTSPDETPTYLGFSPRPAPRLIATRKTRAPALAISKGVDRDRAVDESGHQIAVFNRLGSRPFTLAEMQRLYLRNGRLYTVADEAPAPTLSAPPAAEAQAPLKFTGTASCGASNCHGSTKPKADYPKLNENIVWQQKEQHAKAFETLTNEKLKSKVSPSAIAKKLNIAKAETSDRCLVCHAVNVKPELRGPKFDIADGVHCDGCHGPAEKWLEPHAGKGWTHEQSVKLGMYDTKNLMLRADKCVSCHLQIEADMVAAGHPDLLAFELDTFSLQMPPHWRDKGTWFGARAWATGQVVSLREAAKQVADRAKAGAAPKLMQDAAAKVRGHGAVVRHVFAVLAPDAQKSLETDVAAVTDAAAKGDRAAAGAAAGRIVASTTQQAPKIAARDLDQATTLKLLQGVAGDADGLAAVGIRGAEQGAMALDRLYSTYSKAPGNKPEKAASDALDRAFGILEDPAKYDAAKFAAAVKAFGQAVK